MPQMSPIWWTLMYMIFASSLMMTWIIMFYQMIYNPMTENMKKTKSNTLNWKW